MGVLILAGTRKGLFLVRDNAVEGPLLPGWEVFHAIAADGTLLAAANNFVYGATVQRSTDGGKTWERSEPIEGMARAWHVEPGGNGTLWLGGDPGCLFRSDDGGATWEANAGILEHLWQREPGQRVVRIRVPRRRHGPGDPAAIVVGRCRTFDVSQMEGACCRHAFL